MVGQVRDTEYIPLAASPELVQQCDDSGGRAVLCGAQLLQDFLAGQEVFAS